MKEFIKEIRFRWLCLRAEWIFFMNSEAIELLADILRHANRNGKDRK